MECCVLWLFVYLQTKEFNGEELMEFYKVTPAQPLLIRGFVAEPSIKRR